MNNFLYNLYWSEEMDLASAITEYLNSNGIDNAKVTVDPDRPDPDSNECTLCISWHEDDDRQTFYVKHSERYTAEQVFDMWASEREALHADYLNWIAEEIA